MRKTNPDRPLVGEIRAAYEASAEQWATGPVAVYRRLAVALIQAAPESLAGNRVLDLGAGTGVASDVLVDAGARPIGVDLAVAMLRHERSRRPPGVAADARALPFRDGSVDAVVAAFSLNHVPDPALALAECQRVTRSGGLVLASTFPNDAEHPAKAMVEAVLEEFGFTRPDWYRTFKEHTAARTGDAEAFARAAMTAGLTDVQVDRRDVEAGLDHADVAAEWRLNMPHTIGFVSELDAHTRTELHARATAALTSGLPSSVPMLTLRARAANRSNRIPE